MQRKVGTVYLVEIDNEDVDVTSLMATRWAWSL